MFNHPIGSNNPPAKKKPMAAPTQAMTAEPEEGAMGGEEDGTQVHEQHGPPMAVDTQHEDEMGTHHVHSMHADGHEHHSDHGSREEAHEHVGKLHGIGAKEHAEPADDWDEERHLMQ
jgi:hypothetical protein